LLSLLFFKITPNSDAIALNIGGDSWQMTQVASAYAAAQALNSPTKLFFSLDFTTSLSCDLADIVSRVKQFSGHGWQFKVGGKPMISSYSGDCLGNSGWQSLKDQTGGYLMPFIWGLEGNFGSYPSMDSWYWCVFIPPFRQCGPVTRSSSMGSCLECRSFAHFRRLTLEAGIED
jgi:hypothetical protein